jgi:hypothetical protein
MQSQNTPSTLLKPHYHTIDHHRLTPEDNGAILSNATCEKVTQAELTQPRGWLGSENQHITTLTTARLDSFSPT